MKQSAVLTFCLIFLGLIFPKSIFAISFTLSAPQVDNKNITFNATLSDVTNQNCPTGKCYFQGMITKKDKTEYFGFTKNNAGELKAYVSSPSPDFIKNNFLYCEPVDNSCNLTVSMSFNHDDPKYDGPGEYIVKMKRYTGESSSESFADNDLSVELSLATPTPTSSPTSSPSPSPTPSPTSTPTLSKTPSPTPKATQRVSASMGGSSETPTPSPTFTPRETPEPIKSLENATEPPKILGTTDVDGGNSSTKPIVALFMIAGGVGFVSVAGVSLWRNRYNKNTPSLNE